MNRSLTTLLVAASALGSATAADPGSKKTVDFEQDIRPIFAEKCTLCHGPDDKKGGLRLTGLEYATREADSGEVAIVPGKPEASALVARINHTDPDEVMPPPDKAEPLTEQERKNLEQWIREGAEWPRHWAYEALSRDAPPQVTKHADRVANPIDAFVLARLEQENIAPSPLADPHTQVRRLYYDLVGLPPDPERADAFAKNPTRQAYEALVDELLKSQHFGERWGRHWLDKARYADSDGYEKDNNRPDAWRYRDWVIKAINDDLPFDEFTIQQLAGDLLPDRGEEELIATAFNRQTLTNTEGGTDQEQWRVAAVMDRTETLGAVWLGLTVTCARCHTHKYDEITHKEYYELYAYFNNGDETQTEVVRDALEMEKYEAKRAAHQKLVDAARADLAAAQKTVADPFEKWAGDLHARAVAADKVKPDFHPLKVQAAKSKTTAKIIQDGDALKSNGPNPKTDTVRVKVTSELAKASGIRLEALKHASLPKGGPGRAVHGNFVLSEVRAWLVPADTIVAPPFKTEKSWIPVDFKSARADFEQRGWQAANAVDGDPKTGWAISPQMGKDHFAVFGFRQPLDLRGKTLLIELEQAYGENHVLGLFRLTAMTGDDQDLGVPDAVRKAALKAPGKQTAKDRDLLLQHFSSVNPVTQPLVAKLAELEEKAPEAPLMDLRVLTERENNRRATHIFRRGEFKEPEEEVQPATLSVLPAVAHRDKQGGDRLDLARWLVSGENPLPPRVTVNHLWSNLFGEGLVGTVADFGVRGDRPSHPELLDWLAAEFIDKGWSRKQLIKTIVMSNTYRQSSNYRPELADIDPNNRLLYRQNRFRVEAEVIRDISLAAAGLLSREIGGPSVFPPIPDGVADVNYNSAFKWKVSPGGDRYRRGLYTYFKRTAPHPNLMAFDCPDSNVTCVQRTRSNTPLAALITLNNETFTEAAKALSRDILTDASLKSDEDRLTHSFRRCVTRPPDPEETSRLLTLLKKSRDWYTQNPEAAAELAGSYAVEGEGVPPTESAAWISTVRVILNLDEFLTRN